MSDEDPGQTVRFREFVTSRDELRSRIHAIELEQARLSSSLMHLPSKVDELVTSVNHLSQQVAARQAPANAPEVDHAALALHRAIDKAGNGSISAVKDLMLLGMTAVCSFFLARFFIGG